MHFTGMIASRMGMPVTYDVPITLLSVVVAVASLASFAGRPSRESNTL
jgi:NO-binding membrane sensor protein with MHYT domain